MPGQDDQPCMVANLPEAALLEISIINCLNVVAATESHLGAV